jgi:hypothetical protein
MEKFPSSFEPESHIESTANFEGNDGMLLIERINNPIIKNQIIDLLYQSELAEAEERKSRVYTRRVSTDPEYPAMFEDQHGSIYLSPDPDFTPKDYTPDTREEIEKRINEAISKIAEVTVIDFSEEEPSSECIPLNWKLYDTNQKPTTKQMSIIEAHEKGHVVREYTHLDDHFKDGFDPSGIDYTEKDYEIDLRFKKKDRTEEELTYEQLKTEAMEYLFSSNEIAERMSQLKNYFGISGADLFTKKHLYYAREHYISDTGMDNRMRHFFQAITPETEDAFIELINTSGI